MGVIKSFSKDTLIYGLGNSLKKFIGLFLLPFYTRALTPADYGVLETIGTGIFFLTAFLNLGLDQGAGRYFFMAKTEEEKGQILFNLLVFRTILVIPSVLIAFFSKEISIMLFHSSDFSGVVLLSCLILPLSLLNTDQGNIYRYFREPWKFNIVTIVRILTGIVFGISLVVILKKGVFGAQLSTLISSFTIFLVSFLAFTKKRYHYHFNWYWAKRMLRYSLPLVWAGIAVWVFYSSDRFFILHYKDTVEVGLYSISYSLSQPLTLLNQAINMSYGPFILALYENEILPEKPETKSSSTTIWHLYLFISVTISIFLSMFSVNLVGFITTEAYILGALAMPFLLFSNIATESVEIVVLGISFKEKSGYFAILMSIAAAINVALNFYFVPKFGFIGAAITTLIASVVYLVLSYYVSQKLFFVKRNESSIIIYIVLALLLSIFFPFAELVYHIKIELWLKISIFLITFILPFATGIINYDAIKNNIKTIITKFSL